MAIWGRDKLYSGNDNDGSFVNDDAVASNNEVSGVPKKLKLSNANENELTRNKWLKTMFYQIYKAFSHKIEDRATKTDLGVDTEPTTTNHVVVEQLPVVLSPTNDFTIPFTDSDRTPSATLQAIQLTPDFTGTNKKYSISFTAAFIRYLKAITYVPPVNAQKVLYVNAANVTMVGSDVQDNGDGSVLNPFATIDGGTGVFAGQGGLVKYINDNSLLNQGYGIQFAGGNYTTSNNLSNGNSYYFSIGCIINYTGTEWLFDMNGFNANNLTIGGYLEFTSSTGYFIRSGNTSDVSGLGAFRVDVEFNSAVTTAASDYLIELYGYNAQDKSHRLEGRNLKAPFVMKFGSNSGTLIRCSAFIYVSFISGSILVDNMANFISFYNTQFFYSGFLFTLNRAQFGSLNLFDCVIGTNNAGANVVFDVTSNTFSSQGYIVLRNTMIQYGSAANPSSSVTTMFNVNAVTTALRVDTFGFRIHTLMRYSDVQTAVTPDVANKITNLNAAGVSQYTYPNN